MFSISFVSRETGISAATLRKWEQRYGFPKPNRENGYTRTYSEDELTLLREVKRLLDQGEKPSKLLSAEARHTVMLSVVHPSPVKNKQALFLDEALGLLVTHKIKELRALLEKQLKKIGIFAFIEEVAAPLTIAVGDNWANGTISVFAEHCYSSQLYALLTSVVNAKPVPSDTPIILLATLSGEKHTLGLVMAQTLLFEQGACCINLGAELPLIEFPKAVNLYHANIVGISFSIAFPKRAIVSALVELRASLPSDIALWIGGTGAKQLDTKPTGVQIITSATEVVTAYNNYKEHFNALTKTS
jgi:DNA-binding transcriptional MerR regulator/methylmalonyl-CoA mutase cobalamin-binding subunit